LACLVKPCEVSPKPSFFGALFFLFPPTKTKKQKNKQTKSALLDMTSFHPRMCPSVVEKKKVKRKPSSIQNNKRKGKTKPKHKIPIQNNKSPKQTIKEHTHKEERRETSTRRESNKAKVNELGFEVRWK